MHETDRRILEEAGGGSGTGIINHVSNGQCKDVWDDRWYSIRLFCLFYRYSYEKRNKNTKIHRKNAETQLFSFESYDKLSIE